MQNTKKQVEKTRKRVVKRVKLERKKMWGMSTAPQTKKEKKKKSCKREHNITEVESEEFETRLDFELDVVVVV